MRTPPGPDAGAGRRAWRRLAAGGIGLARSMRDRSPPAATNAGGAFSSLPPLASRRPVKQMSPKTSTASTGTPATRAGMQRRFLAHEWTWLPHFELRLRRHGNARAYASSTRRTAAARCRRRAVPIHPQACAAWLDNIPFHCGCPSCCSTRATWGNARLQCSDWKLGARAGVLLAAAQPRHPPSTTLHKCPATCRRRPVAAPSPRSTGQQDRRRPLAAGAARIGARRRRSACVLSAELCRRVRAPPAIRDPPSPPICHRGPREH